MVTRRKLTPAWRSAKAPIEIVSEPDRRWFDGVTVFGEGMRAVRFALMEDGELLWGDAFTVLHADIVHLGRKVEIESREDKLFPLVGGSLIYDDGVWRIGIFQCFVRSMGREHGMALLAPLFRRLSEWPTIVSALGGDPFDHPPHTRWRDV